ncbi:hypothetical protein D3C81_07880 [compost metagenome]
MARYTLKLISENIDLEQLIYDDIALFIDGKGNISLFSDFIFALTYSTECRDEIINLLKEIEKYVVNTKEDSVVILGRITREKENGETRVDNITYYNGFIYLLYIPECDYTDKAIKLAMTSNNAGYTLSSLDDYYALITNKDLISISLEQAVIHGHNTIVGMRKEIKTNMGGIKMGIKFTFKIDTNSIPIDAEISKEILEISPYRKISENKKSVNIVECYNIDLFHQTDDEEDIFKILKLLKRAIQNRECLSYIGHICELKVTNITSSIKEKSRTLKELYIYGGNIYACECLNPNELEGEIKNYSFSMFDSETMTFKPITKRSKKYRLGNNDGMLLLEKLVRGIAENHSIRIEDMANPRGDYTCLCGREAGFKVTLGENTTLLCEVCIANLGKGIIDALM